MHSLPQGREPGSMMTDEEVEQKFAAVNMLLEKQHARLTRLLRLSDKVLDSTDQSKASQTLVK